LCIKDIGYFTEDSFDESTNKKNTTIIVPINQRTQWSTTVFVSYLLNETRSDFYLCVIGSERVLSHTNNFVIAIKSTGSSLRCNNSHNVFRKPSLFSTFEVALIMKEEVTFMAQSPSDCFRFSALFRNKLT